MSSGFSRRLVLASSLALAGVFSVLIIATALFAFSSYVGAVQALSREEASDVRAYVGVHGQPASAGALAHAIAQRFFRPDLYVTVLDAQDRVIVRARSVASSRLRLSNVAIDVMPRSAIPPAGERGVVARVSLGLATLFGLATERAQFGEIDLIVRPDEGRIVETVQRFAPGFALAELLVCIAAFILANVLTQEALRPLVAVNAALERFATGDLTPQLVSTENRGDLGALARAYNGAIAQMALAFAERDRAESAMHQFIADAGHQLKTPLTVIRGFISVLRKGDLRSADDYERILEKMNRQSLVMGALVEKLILLEHWERAEEPLEPIAIDVAQLVEDVVAPFAEAQPSRRIALDIAPGALAAIDPSDLAHAVTNLVDNALKYTSGSINVRVSNSGERVQVEVADEGPGMTRDELRHAFDRFYRGATRREVDGSGLGLAIAKRAVERAGGSIEASSEPHSGSRFLILLPAAKAA